MPGPISKILLAYDGSPGARDALRVTADLAVSSGAEVVMVHVVDLPSGFLGRDDIPTEVRERSEHALAGGAAQLREHGVAKTDGYTVPGPNPAVVLHDEARALDADLIVVGGSHRGGLQQIFVGTTAEAVLDGAPCPVVVSPRAHADRH